MDRVSSLYQCNIIVSFHCVIQYLTRQPDPGSHPSHGVEYIVTKQDSVQHTRPESEAEKNETAHGMSNVSLKMIRDEDEQIL